MTAPDILPPNLIAALSGTYELLQEIGRGGMGVVHAGRDIRLETLVSTLALQVEDLVADDDAPRLPR